jgi:hypothetical protein
VVGFLLWRRADVEEGGPGVAAGFAEDQNGEFEEVVIAPE